MRDDSGCFRVQTYTETRELINVQYLQSCGDQATKTSVWTQYCDTTPYPSILVLHSAGASSQGTSPEGSWKERNDAQAREAGFERADRMGGVSWTCRFRYHVRRRRG
jgi:hypothetical protein